MIVNHEPPFSFVLEDTVCIGFYIQLRYIGMLDKPYVVDITDQLAPELTRKVKLVASDLSMIAKIEPRVRQIVLRGGAVVDLMLGLEPNDYDLFYSFEEKGKTIEECRCSDVQTTVDKVAFKYFDKTKIELENAYEKEPKAEPIERTCGLLSFHTSYISMFCIDQEGHVWTNTDTWNDFKSKVCEVRYEGMLPWAYFPRPGDSHDYYAFMCYELIRSISYMAKREFSAGEKLTTLIGYSTYFVTKGIEHKGAEGFKKYCKSKNVDASAIRKVAAGLVVPEEVRSGFESAFIGILES